MENLIPTKFSFWLPYSHLETYLYLKTYTYTSNHMRQVLVQVSVGGAVALMCLTLEQTVQVRALARDIVLCSWARHFTLMVPLATRVYKCVPANLMLGVTLGWT